MLRAFGACDPDDVRVILLGQEPYPNKVWATGRAFEQGNLCDWPENRAPIADSLKRIAQVLASARTGRRAYVTGNEGWKDLVRDRYAGRLNLEFPRALYHRLERSGGDVPQLESNCKCGH
jgi:uracil-DNA glycosylase